MSDSERDERVMTKAMQYKRILQEKSLRFQQHHQQENGGKDRYKRMGVDDFEPLTIIGRGAFGEVRLVRRKDSHAREIYAMKSMVKSSMISKNQVQHIRAERDILTESQDSWIVTLYYSFQSSTHLYMVMEYLPGGDLMGLLIKKDTFSERETMMYVAEIAQAVASVHSLGYIHRDLKPDNILLDWTGHIKLIDLGLCKKVEFASTERDEALLSAHIAAAQQQLDTPIDILKTLSDESSLYRTMQREGKKSIHRERILCYSTVGTPDYIAPEVLKNKGYGMDCDWWSLGIIMYECLIGFTPFYAEDPVATCKKILRWDEYIDVPDEMADQLSSECIDLMLSLIADPKERIGCRHGVEDIKRHEWFRTNGLRPEDWGRLRSFPAPNVPAGSSKMNALLEELKHVSSNDSNSSSNSNSSCKGNRYAQLIAEITANFDQFNEDESRDALATSAFAYTSPSVEGTRPQDSDAAAFLNYTYQRQPDHHHHHHHPVRKPIPADLFVNRTPHRSGSTSITAAAATTAEEDSSRLTDRFGASVTSLCFGDK